jgi:drug/metabolite transporter (DMT)-like permease
MNTKEFLVAFLCVTSISVGQILFKIIASQINDQQSILSFRIAYLSFAAITLYVGATVGWIGLLRTVSLSHAYPVMALAFVIVPVGSWLVFGERISLLYFVGTLLIAIGIVIVGIAVADSVGKEDVAAGVSANGTPETAIKQDNPT